MQIIKCSELPQGVRDMLALDAIPKPRQYRRRESESYTDETGKTIRRGDQIRVSGERGLFTFVRHVTRGRREWVECWSDRCGWRSFNLGRRYRTDYVTVPHYRVRRAGRAGKTKAKGGGQ